VTALRLRESGTGRGHGLAALTAVVLIGSAAQLLLMQRDGEAMQSERLASPRHVLAGNARVAARPVPVERPWQLARVTARAGRPAQTQAGSGEAPAIEAVRVDPSGTGAGFLGAPDGFPRQEPVTAADARDENLESLGDPVATGAIASRGERPGFQAIGIPSGPAAPPVDTPAETPAVDDPADPLPPTGALDESPSIGPDDPGAWLDRDGAGAQMMVLGPVSAQQGDLVSFPIAIDGARGVAHAPVHVRYDPDVLEFVGAEEGPFLSMDGAATQFIAQPGQAPGELHIALSRMPPAGGISGSGTLCTLTFVARTSGDTPIVTAGSRLLASSGRTVEFRRNDSHVAIQ